jgi:transcriptional regulator with XRE-family HTH domain
MGQLMPSFTDQKVKVRSRGERVAAYVESYLNDHSGLSQSELAFRLRVNKRDLQRLIRDRSVGHALEDALAAYFGRDFGEAVFGDLWGTGASKRELELSREIAELAARRERLERMRAADKEAAAERRNRPRLAADEDRCTGL